MLELALHILDIAENSVRAQAKTVSITITEDRDKDLLAIKIADDGAGMSEAALERAMDPFYTTKKVRSIGLGLPMLADAAERAGGSFTIRSQEGTGTTVEVVFSLSHIDRQPLGDVAGVIVTLIAGNPAVDFLYRHRCGDKLFKCDTREIRQEIGDVPINHTEVLKFIREHLREGLQEMETNA